MLFAKIKYAIKQEIGVHYAPGKLRNALTAGGKVQSTMSGGTRTSVNCAAGGSEAPLGSNPAVGVQHGDT